MPDCSLLGVIEKMVTTQPLGLLPLWLIYILTVLIFLLATESGFHLEKFVQKRWMDNSEAGVGAMVGASLALLGFLLAFITCSAIGIFHRFNSQVQL
jgi:uncharacterized membrane protein YraQ (UPF0718 family)